jgi:UDP-glucose 4-epimerase
VTVAWVVGARGLLGGALTSAIPARADWQLLEADPLPWHSDAKLATSVRATMTRLVDAAAAAQSSWSVLWVAGAAVTSTPQRDLDAELAQLRRALESVGGVLSSGSPAGSLFYASSAGGVYGGSEHPPFTEASVPAPISPYGHFKLAAEAEVKAFGARFSVPTLVGRIANLYGPGQKLSKMQGLISHIARAQYSPEPASIFVPLDTVRDYIYVADCAALICDAVDRLRVEAAAGDPQGGDTLHITKILASGQAVTIGELLGHFHALAKARPHIMLGQSAASAYQAGDLRLRSTVWLELDSRPYTPLPVGIKATMQSVLHELVS